MSSSTALEIEPLAERTTATVLNAPVAVVIECEVAVPEPVGRRMRMWLPGAAIAVLIAPAASDEMTTLPSIRTSTGDVNALTTRSEG